MKSRANHLATALIAACLAVGLTGCSGSTTSNKNGGDAQGGTQTTGTVAHEVAGSEAVAIDQCRNDAGSATASGKVRNRADQTMSKRVVIEFRDSETDEPLELAIADVGEIEPGGTANWSVGPRQIAADVSIICIPSLEDPPPGS